MIGNSELFEKQLQSKSAKSASKKHIFFILILLANRLFVNVRIFVILFYHFRFRFVKHIFNFYFTQKILKFARERDIIMLNDDRMETEREEKAHHWHFGTR